MTSVDRSESPRRPRKAKPTPAAEQTPAPATSSAASVPSGEGEDDATQGEWLFKQSDLVLGPVTAIVLVDKIKKGELDADTPIARDGQPFQPMKMLKVFRDAIAAREEEKRLAAEDRSYRAAVLRARIGRVFVVLALFAAPAAGAAAGARALMIARPWDDTPHWIAKVPPLVDLPQRPPEVKKDPPPPGTSGDTVAVNSSPTNNAASTSSAPAGSTTIKRTGAPSTTANPAKAGDAPKVGENTPPPKDDKPAGAGALPDTLTNAQAIEPLKGAAGEMKACFKAEMESNPEVPAQVVLSYTVTEEGRAINIALDARELRGRPVVACVQQAISALRWPRFSGERKNVSVPFKLGKPPTKK